jgi:hypothetical protein
LKVRFVKGFFRVSFVPVNYSVNWHFCKCGLSSGPLRIRTVDRLSGAGTPDTASGLPRLP